MADTLLPVFLHCLYNPVSVTELHSDPRQLYRMANSSIGIAFGSDKYLQLADNHADRHFEVEKQAS